MDLTSGARSSVSAFREFEVRNSVMHIIYAPGGRARVCDRAGAGVTARVDCGQDAHAWLPRELHRAAYIRPHVPRIVVVAPSSLPPNFCSPPPLRAYKKPRFKNPRFQRFQYHHGESSRHHIQISTPQYRDCISPPVQPSEYSLRKKYTHIELIAAKKWRYQCLSQHLRHLRRAARHGTSASRSSRYITPGNRHTRNRRPLHDLRTGSRPPTYPTRFRACSHRYDHSPPFIAFCFSGCFFWGFGILSFCWRSEIRSSWSGLIWVGI